MSDLLSNGLGAKPKAAEGSGSRSEPNQTADPSSSVPARGEDIISKTGGKKTAENAASSADTGPNPKSVSSSVEPTGNQVVDDWTTDSALKEIKKLREENKQYRLKYAEQIEKVKTESEAMLTQKEQEMAHLAEAKAELDKLKAEQEDKKRDLTEKVAHREARISELQHLFEQREKDYKKALSSMEQRVKMFEADREAEMQVYKSRLEEELATVPEQFKDVANLLVKGAGDARDAVLAITEARVKGIFQDKTVVVNHSVPNAYDGARSSKEKLEEVEKARRSKLTGQQKIGEAIKGIRSGAPNSIYKPR